MIYLYSDIITQAGGIETYLHALATKLDKEGIPFRVAVSEQEHCPMLDDLEAEGINVYRQPQVPGDQWHVRRRLLMLWLWWHLKPGDWVYCVRQPTPALYRELVGLVHDREARIAASWMFAPEFYVPKQSYFGSFCRAVEETDVVISVSECTKHQFEEVYGYEGDVEVVRYHNLPLFDEPVPLPEGPPWNIGYMGRMSIRQKNLDTLLQAFKRLHQQDSNVRLNLYGGGPDEGKLKSMASDLGVGGFVSFNGSYDHRRDLKGIIERNHIFVYTSNYEGGPCFSLLELLQAGRYVVASKVGGIPDLYEENQHAGHLVEQPSTGEIKNGIREGLQKIKSRDVDPESIRSIYLNDYSLDVAHGQWSEAILK